MKNSDLMLFFFIIYSIVITIVFTIKYFMLKEEYNKIDKYNEELIFELVKIRKKCYSKNKEG